MVTIAHEGNPRFTPDLVLVGTLDGNATLLLQFPESERPIPAPRGRWPVPTNVQETCGQVFSWPGAGEGVPPVNLVNFLSQSSISRYKDTVADIQISPSAFCYGIISVLHPIFPGTLLHNSVDGRNPYQSIEFDATFMGLTSGAPRAGICIYVPDFNDLHSVKTFGLITDWNAGTTGLYFWDGVPGAGGELFDFQQAIEVANFTPSVGQIYQLFITALPSDAPTPGVSAHIRNSTNTTTVQNFSFYPTFINGNGVDGHFGFIAPGGGSPGVVHFGGVGSILNLFTQVNTGLDP